MNRGALVAREKLGPRGLKAKLARDLEIGQDLVSRWLSGERVPDTKQRAFLEDEFGIGWRLWDEEETKPEDPPEEPPASSPKPSGSAQGAA